LNGPSDDLRGAGAVLVYEHYEGKLEMVTRAGRAVLLVGAADTSVSVDDHLVLLQKAIGNPDCLLQQATRVPPQIEDETCHALFLQRPDPLVKLMVRGARKILDLDVPSARADHEGLPDAVGRNVVSRDGEMQDLRITRPGDRDRHLGSVRSLEPLQGRADRHIDVAHPFALRDGG